MVSFNDDKIINNFINNNFISVVLGYDFSMSEKMRGEIRHSAIYLVALL